MSFAGSKTQLSNNSKTKLEEEKRLKGKDESDDKLRKVKARKPPFSENHIVGNRGICKIQNSFHEAISNSSGNDEESKLRRLIFMYKQWGHQMYPGLPFDDLMCRLEKLGSRERVRNALQDMRETEKKRFLKENLDIDPSSLVSRRHEYDDYSSISSRPLFEPEPRTSLQQPQQQLQQAQQLPQQATANPMSAAASSQWAGLNLHPMQMQMQNPLVMGYQQPMQQLPLPMPMPMQMQMPYLPVPMAQLGMLNQQQHQPLPQYQHQHPHPPSMAMAMTPAPPAPPAPPTAQAASMASEGAAANSSDNRDGDSSGSSGGGGGASNALSAEDAAIAELELEMAGETDDYDLFAADFEAQAEMEMQAF